MAASAASATPERSPASHHQHSSRTVVCVVCGLGWAKRLRLRHASTHDASTAVRAIVVFNVATRTSLPSADIRLFATRFSSKGVHATPRGRAAAAMATDPRAMDECAFLSVPLSWSREAGCRRTWVRRKAGRCYVLCVRCGHLCMCEACATKFQASAHDEGELQPRCPTGVWLPKAANFDCVF